MKYLTEFRDKGAATALAREIVKEAGDRQMTFMEVCGTHTMSIARFALRQLLPQNIKLLSGPGCPVCVTPNGYIDHAIAIARRSDTIITTFGDMMKVPGSTSSLYRERSSGADIRIVYSTSDAIKIAKENPEKKIVFLGVGFETTAPTIAASIIQAEKDLLTNYFVLSANKLVPPALEALLKGELRLDGFILPGHVSAIIGAKGYDGIVDKHGIACAVAGFEPTDILEGILCLVNQVKSGRPTIDIPYRRSVDLEGNKTARDIMERVFEKGDAEWRGIGVIPESGLAIRKSFVTFDAAHSIEADIEPTLEEKGCICGEILQGLKDPKDCPLFGKRCTPETPVGACMVSSEGTCAAWHKYGVLVF